MGLPETVDFARNFAVMVKIQGPDPKGLKMRKHAFHQYNSGKTTLSASGLLLPETLYDADLANRILEDQSQGLGLVVTVASVIEPFLSSKHRESTCQGRPKLIPGAQIDVMVEGKLDSRKDADGGLDKGASRWLSAQVMRLVDVPVSSVALQSLVEASSGSMDHGWEVGWSLASHENGPQPFIDVSQTQTEHGNSFVAESQRRARGESNNPSIMGKSTTRVAILAIFFLLKDLPNFETLASSRRGGFLLAVGSPFGILSPLHFFNSLSVGSIANCYPPRSSDISLLMADIRCLPGMEGSPVFGENSNFIGILIRPLRQKSSGAEIQLVIPWEAIATACSDLLLKEPQNMEKGIHINKENLNAVGNAYSSKSDGPLPYMYKHHNSYCPSPMPAEKAMASICLITTDEAVWASGVLLNDQGLILTNAHLLEPWRFGKTAVNGGEDGTKLQDLFIPHEFPRYSEVDDYEKIQRLPPKTLNIVDSSVADESKTYKLSLSYKGHRNIRVRLDHTDPWIWCDAKVVYICKGPLDVALLQLEQVPDQLCPIKVDFECPSLGSKAYVIGHGLFGPRSGFSPSVCSGVVSKVVKAKAPPYCQSVQGGNSHISAMLETTAAVHPGGSGGAVVNSEGHMIGLVTSNARHGGGTVIPYLNFSIPCAVLAPIFDFAKEMRDISLLQNLDQPNERLSSVWALMPPLSPKLNPPLPTLPESILQDSEKQVKGSKFAKFIAERDKLFRGSTQLGKAGRISNVFFPSKL